MSQESNIPWLIVPPRVESPPNHRMQYGADLLAARHCGLRCPPPYFEGYWAHGWIASYFACDPRLIMGEIGNEKANVPYRVAREDEALYLKQHGYNARAIGLPIAYTQEPSVKRRPGSLLVMPAHSLEYTTHRWKFREYAEEIADIRSDFSEIVVCCHPSCAVKGYWIDEFARLGIPIIIGASATDSNALIRIRHLMEQFEYVTTNAYGSCVAYAAAFGAKVSIFGSYAEVKAEDFRDCMLCQKNPGFAEENAQLCSEGVTRTHLGELFTHPAGAIERREWGLQQIGHDKILSGDEMRREFDWHWGRRAEKAAIRNFWSAEMKLMGLVPRTAKNFVQKMIGRGGNHA